MDDQSPIINMIVSFWLGCIWQITIGIQTKFLVSDSKWYYLASWSIITSLIYCYLIKTITIGQEVFIPYAIGTGVGVTFSRDIANKLIDYFDKKGRENART